MKWFRRRGESNTVVGIILLLMLAVYVLPSFIPNILSRTFPFVDQGVPCTRLKTGENRAAHQSLIGRFATNPIEVRVDPGAVPVSTDGIFTVRLIITNLSVGTVPILFDEDEIIIGDQPGTSGFGLIFNPPTSLSTGGVRTNGSLTSFPEASIRLLGPRQRCVHRVEFPANQLDNTIRSGQATVSGYYRITSNGVITNAPFGTRVIYNEQGLAVVPGGYTQSAPVQIPITVFAN